MDEQLKDEIRIRDASYEDWKPAMNLAFKVFMKFEAPVYSQEGIQNFYNFVTDERLEIMFHEGLYILKVAECDGRIVGVISTRSRSHISLLFVDAQYHKQGIGRRLMEAMKQYSMDEKLDRLTVNAAPYAVEFYHKQGFTDTDTEQLQDGIRYTPMIWRRS